MSSALAGVCGLVFATAGFAVTGRAAAATGGVAVLALGKATFGILAAGAVVGCCMELSCVASRSTPVLVGPLFVVLSPVSLTGETASPFVLFCTGDCADLFCTLLACDGLACADFLPRIALPAAAPPRRFGNVGMATVGAPFDLSASPTAAPPLACGVSEITVPSDNTVSSETSVPSPLADEMDRATVLFSALPSAVSFFSAAFSPALFFTVLGAAAFVVASAD